MKKLTTIDDIIAEGVWHCYTHDGKERPTKITIGRPTRDQDDPNTDWYCPIQIEHFTEGIITAMGVGPLDSLINAMNFLNSFFHITGVAPGFGGPRKKQQGGKSKRSTSNRNRKQKR